MPTSLYFANGEFGKTVSSSDCTSGETSKCSSHPPGFKCLSCLSVSFGHAIDASSPESLCVESRPVFDTSKQSADVNVVEVLRSIVPIPELAILYDKTAIGRDHVWLDGIEICTDNGRIGKLLCKVNRPDARSCSDVEDVLHFVPLERGEVEPRILQEVEEMVTRRWLHQ